MNRTDVIFDSAGISLAGHLYLPSSDAAAPVPAVVVGHPGTGVKEQTAGTYAARLAEQGFVTLAFDAAYQGESGGLPRGLEDPAHRVEDLKAAVSYLATRPEVDAGRIGMLGICASGGYGIAATAGDHRVRALATVSGVDVGRQFREGADGSQPSTVVQGMLDAAAVARTAEARGEGTGMFPVFPGTAEEARALGGRHGFEGFEYYRTERGAHPRSATEFTWSSVDRIATSDQFRFVGLIAPRPLLVVQGTEAVTKHMGTLAFAEAHEPKELHWIEGASHVDLYDRPGFVGPVVEKLTGFFTQGLAAA
ncbi:alpha/beta hydrolase [Promicromonospora sp. MEB111]|uniref:alpha/beta hydrolase n=1 Tax=Promicromonospora sp. MEB111 TaxID=3040301 RepID=UPI00254B0919|nr:alpha/beta hydrolase [Promicromonospora sp. MEB111]